jgi:hypothetical protein
VPRVPGELVAGAAHPAEARPRVRQEPTRKYSSTHAPPIHTRSSPHPVLEPVVLRLHFGRRPHPPQRTDPRLPVAPPQVPHHGAAAPTEAMVADQDVVHELRLRRPARTREARVAQRSSTAATAASQPSTSVVFLARPLRTERTGGGAPAFHPLMMVKVLLYAYTNGIMSSRRIVARACNFHLRGVTIPVTNPVTNPVAQGRGPSHPLDETRRPALYLTSWVARVPRKRPICNRAVVGSIPTGGSPVGAPRGLRGRRISCMFGVSPVSAGDGRE